MIKINKEYEVGKCWAAQSTKLNNGGWGIDMLRKENI